MGMTFDLKETVEFVQRLCGEQAQLARDQWTRMGAISYKNQRDFVTEVDLQIENNLKSALRRYFPNHGFCGEETAAENEDAIYQWLIDPIDGTKWYAAQSSLFAISIALLQQGEPVLGVIHAPASHQCFYAYRGGGSFLDGRRLPGPKAAKLSTVIANVDTLGTDTLSPDERSWFEHKFIELTRKFYRVRCLGLGSLSACWLASGALDAYIDLTGYIKPQDLAAGRIIMSEVGVRLEYIALPLGPPRLVAAPPQIWEALVRLLTA